MQKSRPKPGKRLQDTRSAKLSVEISDLGMSRLHQHSSVRILYLCSDPAAPELKGQALAILRLRSTFCGKSRNPLRRPPKPPVLETSLQRDSSKSGPPGAGAQGSTWRRLGGGLSKALSLASSSRGKKIATLAEAEPEQSGKKHVALALSFLTESGRMESR